MICTDFSEDTEMTYQYNFEKSHLLFDSTLLPLIKHEIDEIGICLKCSSPLKLLSAHIDAAVSNSSKNNAGQKFLVSKCTKCSSVYVNIYDLSWSWLADIEPELIELKIQDSGKKKIFKIPVYTEIINTSENFKKIPAEQLKTVFSTAEIQAILQKANGEKTIRQYYHRAKKKYSKFEEIYGIKINI